MAPAAGRAIIRRIIGGKGRADVRGVLFDLDGTLLSIDLDAFLGRYFAALEEASRPLIAASADPRSFMRALHDSTGSMMREHPGRTNRDVFFDDLRAATGVDLREAWPIYEAFYREVFPTLGDTARPAPGARRVIETALALGLRVAVATNPIFPRIAVDHRMTWAGIADLGIEVVTTYETMQACKPHAAYFRQTADMLGIPPDRCMMVGDDRVLDMPAAEVGMRTFYVGPEAGVTADFSGTLDDLADLLPRLV